tara:strand:- start:1684 stop:2187 length:504 start_codon:yes stop_codon:yes gene_type:complete
MAYFTHFNKINYDIKGIDGNLQLKSITNLLQRVRLKVDFIDDRVFFSEYFVQDGQTPESVAYDFYGDSELHWIIMYAQRITNPYYDWPLIYFDLNKFINKKYGANGATNVHHYEDSDGDEVDSTAAGATTITNFVYEERLNDKKRNIRIIKPEYTASIIKELKGLLK